MEKKGKYSLEINWNTEELIRFLEENKIKTLNYLRGQMDSNNKVICGDGIDALSSLIISGDKFEVIMIDPPYNENKSKGKYKDQWLGSGKDFSWAGDSHGAYMDFLYPRVILGRESLTEDGIMMLFIGDGEQQYVKVLMDKVFGEGNYIGTVIWESSSNQQKSKLIDRNHEFVFIYAKNINYFPGLYRNKGDTLGQKLYEYSQSLNRNDFKVAEQKYLQFYKDNKSLDKNNNFRYLLPEEFVPFNCGDAGDPRDGNKKQLKHPVTNKKCPLPRNGKGWAFSQEYLDRISNSKNITVLHDGRVLVQEQHPKVLEIKGIVFGKDEKGVPNTCRIYSSKTDKKVMPTTGWVFKGDKKEGIDPKVGFETVKPHEFLTELLLNYPNKSSRVLDNFSGSGTLAVSVNNANLQDAGNRSWTMVELNEDTVKNVMLPKLNYFGIHSFKEMNVSAINLSTADVDKFFRKFLLNYIQSEREYAPIENESSLGYTVIGVEKDTLILSTVQKTEEQKSPRPSVFAKEIEPYLSGQIKKVFVYLVGSDEYRSSWDALVKDTIVNKTKIAAKDIKIAPIGHELKAKWEGLIDTLSQYDEKQKG